MPKEGSKVDPGAGTSGVRARILDTDTTQSDNYSSGITTDPKDESTGKLLGLENKEVTSDDLTSVSDDFSEVTAVVPPSWTWWNILPLLFSNSNHGNSGRQKDDLDGEDFDDGSFDIASVTHKATESAEEFVRKIWEEGWNVIHHTHLPKWLRDNDFLVEGHRPQLHTYKECFKSVFRIHTETGNIWTHLLGFIAFITVTVYFLTRPTIEVQWQEKAVFSAFFAGAILCLGFSWIFHTVYCHSEGIGKLFNKLDYCGIAILTMGSFVPWLYYSFYCRLQPKVVYLVLIFALGTICIVVSLWDKFSEPRFRALRAGVFIALGLSGVIPAMHYVITDGFWHAINFASLGWLVLMAILYISGAVIYAVRIPERIWPGKFDIWFQSHQIFHMFVIAAAFVHYHGISKIADYRLTMGDCLVEE